MSGAKILIVDDERVNIEILQHLLASRYTTRTAMTGEDAIDTAIRFVPDLVLLDIMLPGIDGYEVCRRIRTTPSLEATRVIMISARAMESDRRLGFEAGTDDYLTKPFRKADLFTSMQVHLEDSSVDTAVDTPIATGADRINDAAKPA